MTTFKTHFALSLVGGLFATLSAAQAAFPGASANATQYNVSVTKVELCQSAACSSPYTLGSGTKVFDIASGTAGADVGSYIDISGLPLYQTWSHVRVTMGSSFTIAASGVDDQGAACRTDSTNNTSSHTALGVALAGAGTGTGQNFVVPNVGAFAGNPTVGDYSGYNLSKSNNASTMTITLALPSPYTCKGVMPRVEVKFNTQNTVKFYDTNGAAPGNSCAGVYALPPTVTITVSDP
ncbi:MAG: hypothetical protein JKY27_07155 [Magnetovibrio sp.]|nr:hypothetical protein [Magnetovibrio sp.]